MSDWLTHAACRGLHSRDEANDHMFPMREDTGHQLRRAKRTCVSCPVRSECLTAALRVPEVRDRNGVLGGLSPVERSAKRRGALVQPCRQCQLWTATIDGLPVCGACRFASRRWAGVA